MDFKQFIALHENEDPNKLRLSVKKNQYKFDVDSAILQIECRKKYHTKLKDFIANPEFIFPDTISGEQASHMAVARFHALLFNNFHKGLDMTAGLGIDSLSMAMGGQVITAVELNKNKALTLQHNAMTLEINNLKVINDDSISYLKTSAENFDFIFVDPSRRDSNSNRVYNLKHCSPDVLENQELLLEKAEKVFIKASPLLDISQTIKDFKNISSIRTIGVKGECKEILIELSSENPNDEILLEAVDLDNEGGIINRFSTKWEKESSSYVCDSKNLKGEEYASMEDFDKETYVLEPSAMVMKLASWKELCHQFGAKKLAPSSHLFISKVLPQDFPGRVTKFIRFLNKQDRKTLSGFPASVVSRNHPLSSDEIRKSLKLKEGDKNFIYATRVGSKPIMLESVAR